MIVRSEGGLGNQFFQYAAALALTYKNNEKLYIETYSYRKDKQRAFELSSYNVQYCKYGKLHKIYYRMLYYLCCKKGRDKLLRHGIYVENEECMYQEINARAKYLIGFFQCPRYFEELKQQLKNQFIYLKSMPPQVKEQEKIIKQNNSIAVHVRRGDYLEQSNECVVQEVEYYKNAICKMENDLKECQFYFFSDDINWCIQQFGYLENVSFIIPSTSPNQHTDFWLMRSCKHFIISNSTFSWWAAWLSEEGSKVIVPSKWFENKERNDIAKQLWLKDWLVL